MRECVGGCEALQGLFIARAVELETSELGSFIGGKLLEYNNMEGQVVGYVMRKPRGGGCERKI